MNDYNNDLYKYFAYRFLMIALLAIFSVSGYANDCLTELKKNFPNMEFIKPSYAKNFELYRNKVKSSDFTFLKINKLWIGDKLGKDYFISNNPPKKLKELKSCHRVKLINNKNLKRIIPLSTTYVAFLEALKLEQTIISFPNTNLLIHQDLLL